MSKITRTVYCLLFTVYSVLAAACDSTTADVAMQLSPEARDTAIVGQLNRDADATEISRAATRQADLANIAGTYEAGTAQAVANLATATAISANATAESDRHATETQAASVIATQAYNAGQTSTAVSEHGATETAQVISTQTAITLTTQEAQAARERWTADLLSAARFVIGAIGVAILVITAVVALRIWRKRSSMFTHGPFGVPLILLDGPHGQQIILDPLRLLAPAVTIDGSGQLAAPELAPVIYQENTTARAQAVAMQQAMHSPHQPVAPPALIDYERTVKIGPFQSNIHTKPAIPAEAWRTSANDTHSLPAPLVQQSLAAAPDLAPPPWSLFTGWRWNANTLPIGAGPDGLIALDPEHDPHVMIAGTTGAGKTRHGLTVLAAGALRLGWHVVVLNRAGSDFQPLAAHPRLHIFDDPGSPLSLLKAAAAEVDRRNETLRAANASTWSRLDDAPPRILIIIDELVALTQSMVEERNAAAIWRNVVHVTSAGRKCGLHVAFATTDPTHKTLGRLGLVARDNCARVAFRLRTGQAIMPGGSALDLAPRRFLALTSAGNAPQPGAAFAPTDDDLVTFAASANHAPAEPLPLLVSRPDPEPQADRIRALRAQGLSLNVIQDQLFGYRGGAAYAATRAALEGDTT